MVDQDPLVEAGVDATVGAARRPPEPPGHRYTVAVDFDGVIHSYTSGWQGSEDIIADPPVEGAIDWLNEISKSFTVVIHTTRASNPRATTAIREYLLAHGYAGPPVEVTNQKVPALVYVDDRGWRFTGRNFPTVQQIHDARPWNGVPAS